jgi:hypothetical protein
MSQNFDELSDMMFLISEKVSDIEYKNIMDKMLEIRNFYIKDRVAKDTCECVEHELCVTSMEHMITCKNLQLIIRHMPQFKCVFLPIDALFDMNEENTLQFEPTGFDIVQTNNEKFKNIQLITNIFGVNNENNNTYGKFTKLFTAIALFDFMFRNFAFLNIMPKLKLSVYSKLSNINEEMTELQLIIVKNIYKLDESPFLIWKRNMELYMCIEEGKQ